MLPYPPGAVRLGSASSMSGWWVICGAEWPAAARRVSYWRARVEQSSTSAVARGVRCADGREYRGVLVVAADGRHSKVRRLLGIPADTTLLSQMVVVTSRATFCRKPGFGHVFLGRSRARCSRIRTRRQRCGCASTSRSASPTGRTAIARRTCASATHASFRSPSAARWSRPSSAAHFSGARQPRDLHVDVRRPRRGARLATRAGARILSRRPE